MNLIYNQHCYVSHFMCDQTLMNHVHTQKSKSESDQIIQQFMIYVKKQYECIVQIIQINSETFLSKEFENQMNKESVTIEQSSFYMQAQNEAIEQLSALIMIKACCL